MNQQRIQLLDKYISEDPSDPFNYYGLAMEYQSELPEKALELMDFLHKNHPSYLPNYFQYGTLLSENSQEEKALAIFKEGIDLAIKQKNHKAEAELRSAHQNLLYELD